MINFDTLQTTKSKMLSDHITAYEIKILDWFERNGHPEHLQRCIDISNNIELTKGEAGRYWDQCPFTQESIALQRKAIREEAEYCTTRYEDWASD